MGLSSQFQIVFCIILTGFGVFIDAHGLPLKILGSEKGVADIGVVPEALRAEAIVRSTSPPTSSVEPRSWKPKPNPAKKQCGPGHGPCDPGYW